MSDTLKYTEEVGGRIVDKAISIVGGTHGLGYGLALRFAKAGKRVIIGSREKSKAERYAEVISERFGRSRVQGFENSTAVAQGQIVIFAVPFQAQEGTAKLVRNKLSPGSVVIDVAVPLQRDGRAFGILQHIQTSSAEQLRGLLPENVIVISAFKNVSAVALQQVDQKVDCDVIVCGDDSVAKEEASELVRCIEGARPIDGGFLKNSRLVESLTALLININMIYGSNKAGVRLTGITEQKNMRKGA